ncbi:MAG: homogentisate phytyltransferase [Chitinophagales bacterium]
MKVIKNFILYSRLHTVIGTILSNVALYFIAFSLSDKNEIHFVGFILTLICCLGANIYIVGINQIADIEIDRINKPYLPLASGAYTLKTAYIINTISLVISVGIAFYYGKYLLVTVLSSLFLGTIYSLPPFRLKRYYFWAAFCIIAVRGLIVNIFLFLHFHFMLKGFYIIPPTIKLLTAAIFVYSVVIAWFKDIPDMEGDKQYRISTLSLKMGAKRIFITGNILLLLTMTVLITAVAILQLDINSTWFISLHILMIMGLIFAASKTHLDKKPSIARYYQFVWGLFFMEYITFALSTYLR